MLQWIHPLVLYANDQHSVAIGPVIYNVGLMVEASNDRGNLIKTSPEIWVLGKRLETGFQTIAV